MHWAQTERALALVEAISIADASPQKEKKKEREQQKMTFQEII